MTYNNLPLLSLDVLKDIDGVELISLVDCPAVERDFIRLSKDSEVRLKVNDEKRVITGVALIPNQKIYRNDESGEYYIQFSKDAIERIAQKFFKDGNSSNCNLMHSVDVDGCSFFESMLINKERGICPIEFNDLPDGTWIVSCKVYNDDVWELVKNGTLRGFSIEGNLREKTEIDSLQELIDSLRN